MKLALNSQKLKVIRTICRVFVFIQLAITQEASEFFMRSVYVGHLFVFLCCVLFVFIVCIVPCVPGLSILDYPLMFSNIYSCL